MSDKIFLKFKDITKEIPTPKGYNELLNSFLKEFEIKKVKKYSFRYFDGDEDEIELDDSFSPEELKDAKDNIIYIREIEKEIE